MDRQTDRQTSYWRISSEKLWLITLVRITEQTMTLKGPEEYLQRGLWAVLQQICKIWPQKSRGNTLPTKVHIVKAMVFPVDTYGCESWTIKKAECWRIDAFELWYLRALESPLNSKEIKPVNPKGNQLWIFIGRTDAEAPILWPLDAKRQLIGKDLNAGKDWGQKEKGETEDEMVGWQHRLDGHGFAQTPRDSKGQGSLVCCSPMGSQRVRNYLVTEQQHFTGISKVIGPKPKGSSQILAVPFLICYLTSLCLIDLIYQGITVLTA